jgi:adenylate cyclase
LSDIFISYARSTAGQAGALGEALRALGYSVWRDSDLPSHRPYGDVIAEQLGLAKAVVMVWSAEATSSHWVRAGRSLPASVRMCIFCAQNGMR